MTNPSVDSPCARRAAFASPMIAAHIGADADVPSAICEAEAMGSVSNDDESLPNDDDTAHSDNATVPVWALTHTCGTIDSND